MQDTASEYPRDDARTLPRRPLTPTQRRIPASAFAPPTRTDEAPAMEAMEAMEAIAPSPRVREDSAARALSGYSGASAMGAPTMLTPGIAGGAQSGGMGQATLAPGL